MTAIKANVANIAASKKNIEGYRKENSFYQEIAALYPKTGRAVVAARFYGPSSTAYCVVWVAGPTSTLTVWARLEVAAITSLVQRCNTPWTIWA